MSIEHVDITDPDIHEPKDVASASAGDVYVADGAGSGTWQPIDADDIDTSSVFNLNTFWLTVVISDIGTADSILIPAPRDCTFVAAKLTLGGAITGANDSVSFKDYLGASMGTATTITQSGSAKGDTYTFTASANNVLTTATAKWMEITNTGASTGAQHLTVVCEFTVES